MAVVKRRTSPEEFLKKKKEEMRSTETQNREIAEIQNRQIVETTIKEIAESNEEQQYSLENFKASKSQQKSIIRTNQGAITIVNTKNNGKRVVISKDIKDELGNPSRVLISFSDKEIAIGERLPDNENYLNVKYSKTKGTIYSVGTVNELTEIYQLDFSNRTSITFSEVKYTAYENHKVAIITID